MNVHAVRIFICVMLRTGHRGYDTKFSVEYQEMQCDC